MRRIACFILSMLLILASSHTKRNKSPTLRETMQVRSKFWHALLAGDNATIIQTLWEQFETESDVSYPNDMFVDQDSYVFGMSVIKTNLLHVLLQENTPIRDLTILRILVSCDRNMRFQVVDTLIDAKVLPLTLENLNDIPLIAELIVDITYQRDLPTLQWLLEKTLDHFENKIPIVPLICNKHIGYVVQVNGYWDAFSDFWYQQCPNNAEFKEWQKYYQSIQYYVNHIFSPSVPPVENGPYSPPLVAPDMVPSYNWDYYYGYGQIPCTCPECAGQTCACDECQSMSTQEISSSDISPAGSVGEPLSEFYPSRRYGRRNHGPVRGRVSVTNSYIANFPQEWSEEDVIQIITELFSDDAEFDRKEHIKSISIFNQTTDKKNLMFINMATTAYAEKLRVRLKEKFENIIARPANWSPNVDEDAPWVKWSSDMV